MGTCLFFVACQGPVAAPAPDPVPDPPAAVATEHPDPPQPKVPAPPAEPEPPPVVDTSDWHDYRIEDLAAEITQERSIGHVAQFTTRITNHGGVDGPLPIPISARLDREIVELDQTIENALAGDVVELAYQHRLGAGSHQFALAVGSERRSVVIHVPAADIAVSAGDYRVIAPGQVALPVKVSNLGDAPARHLEILGSWTLVPSGYVDRSSDRYLVRELAPDATEEFDLEFEVLRGLSRFQISAEQPILDRDWTNNLYEKQVFILYDWLSLDVAGPAIYYADRQPFAQFRFTVQNQGVEHSPQVWAGFIERSALERLEDFPAVIADLPRCGDQLTAQCWWGSEVFSVRAGRQHALNVRLPLDVGEHSLIAFVGGPHYDSKGSRDNIVPVQTRVVPQPTRAFSGTLRPGIQGYYSNGQASIQVSATVANWGFEPVPGPLPAQLLCRLPGEDTPVCRQGLEIDLGDGFGPVESGFKVRVPMGKRLEFELLLAGERVAAAGLNVPAKILNVDRFIWDCYSARNGYHERSLAVPPGCGGWDRDMVYKWWRDEPVKVWTTGRADYRAMFDAVLARIGPLTNLEFVPVASEGEADLRAHLGVSDQVILEIHGPGCAKVFHGCGGGEVDYGTGIIHAGEITVRYLDWDWLSAADVRFVIGHELWHSLLGVGHRPTPDYLMADEVSPSDAALIALNSHPLVEPGMTMGQVRELVVLSDELLDPPPTGAHQILWRAGAALHRSGGARYELSGDWTGTCQYPSFGPATFELARPDWHHMIEARVMLGGREYYSQRAWWQDAEWRGGGFWEKTDGRWQMLEDGAAISTRAATGWSHRLTDPLSLLHAATAYGGPIRIADLEGGAVTLAAASLPQARHFEPFTDVRLVVDEQTGLLREFAMTRTWSDSCHLRVEGKNGEYGIPVEAPV